MTTAGERTYPSIFVEAGVYAPQEDSFLLCNEIARRGSVSGARVLDMCTGSGIAAIEAARNGAREVFAYDISERAVACAGANAVTNGVDVDVRVGTLRDAVDEGPFDVIVSNPPYVPSPHDPSGAGLHRAWDAGDRGRIVLDLLCSSAFELLVRGGVLLMVQSEFSDTEESLRQLRLSGLRAGVVRRQTIEFGPVMHQRSSWLEATGKLEIGCRREELVIIEGHLR